MPGLRATMPMEGLVTLPEFREIGFTAGCMDPRAVFTTTVIDLDLTDPLRVSHELATVFSLNVLGTHSDEAAVTESQRKLLSISGMCPQMLLRTKCFTRRPVSSRRRLNASSGRCTDIAQRVRRPSFPWTVFLFQKTSRRDMLRVLKSFPASGPTVIGINVCSCEQVGADAMYSQPHLYPEPARQSEEHQTIYLAVSACYDIECPSPVDRWDRLRRVRVFLHSQIIYLHITGPEDAPSREEVERFAGAALSGAAQFDACLTVDNKTDSTEVVVAGPRARLVAWGTEDVVGEILVDPNKHVKFGARQKGLVWMQPNAFDALVQYSDKGIFEAMLAARISTRLALCN